jgi:predicted GTPase
MTQKDRRSGRQRVLILGAAGRDFHDFNTVFRDDAGVEVVAFTATQIPGIGGRRYPASLAGPLYPDGIPIEDESRLEEICAAERVDQVVLAYSDLTHPQAMHMASRALATGAGFRMLGPRRTMLRSSRPVVAVSAVRTGCGKSQTARWLAARLRDRGLRVVALRHPMPYGDLEAQRVQRFASHQDIDDASCTAEEREEYEPYVEAGAVVYAGVDYAAILARAEQEAQVILWDGGNNDFPFVEPQVHVVLVDALRPDQVDTHHPGEATLRMADIVVVNKVESASSADVQQLVDGVRRVRPEVPIVRASSPVRLDDPRAVYGRRALVVDDGPTLTHGGMAYGAGYVAATAAGAAEIVDPWPWAPAAMRAVREAYPHLRSVLPAMGYSEQQLDALRQTLDAAEADVIVSGTPIDLARLIELDKPVVRARYAYADAGPGTLEGQVMARLAPYLEKEG